MTEGRWPPTEPGPFCSWCGAVSSCPDASDLARAEFEANGPSSDPDDGEAEPW